MEASFFRTLAKQALAMDPWPDPRFPPSPYYRFFRLLAANLHPALSVELGTCGGGASFHLAMGWPDGKVVGVDVSNSYPENIAHIEEQCPNFKFMRGDSIELAPDIGKENGPVDILFIDTVHTRERTLDEFYAYEPYLADNAVVCIDDLLRPGMEDAWWELPGNRVRLDKVHHGGAPTDGGFGVIWF